VNIYSFKSINWS